MLLRNPGLVQLTQALIRVLELLFNVGQRHTSAEPCPNLSPWRSTHTSANKSVLVRPDLMRSPDVRCQHSKHAAADVALSASGISSKHPELTENCAWPRARLR